MEIYNKISEETLKTYGIHSIKFRLIVSSALIFIISALLIIISLYTFEVYFKQIDYYSASYYEVINFRNNFRDMCESAENYMKNNNEEDMAKYNSAKQNLDNYADSLRSHYNELGEDEQKAIVHAVYNSYINYSKNLSKLIESENPEESLTEYYEVYKENETFIDSYIEVFLNHKFKQGQEYHTDMQEKLKSFKIAEISSFVFLISIICYILVTTFNNIVKPVLNVSKFSDELACGNLDIEDIDTSELKKDDEIKNLISTFNKMKKNMKEMIEIKNKNYQMKEIINQEKHQNEILSQKANYDNLTAIFNRNAFEANVKKSLEQFNNDSLGALFIIDLDNFKTVNDTLGHQGGDEVLKLLANCLSNTLSECGFAGRYGGDEFVGFITNAESLDFITSKAEALCRLMNRKFVFKGIIHNISISVGVCPVQAGYELKTAYENADKMLYEVKESGRNNYKVYSSAENKVN